MIKIWAKTVRDDKITRDTILKSDEKYSSKSFMNYLVDICHGFDIPTPIVLKSHTKNFERFNITRFRASDFIESIDFDTLVLENASE